MYFCPHLDQQNGRCDINEICFATRYCGQIKSYYNNESAINCKILKEKNMTTNIVFVKNNNIYVKLKDKDMVVVVPNIYGDNIPAMIDIVEYENNYYIKGTEPKEEKKKH